MDDVASRPAVKQGRSAVYLGKIVKSNSHIDYVCQVYGPGEIETPPTCDEYAFGNFVRIVLPNNRWLIGVIYDTLLLNPDFGRLGPRLSPEPDLAVFSPDYLNEKVVLVGIVAVGIMHENGPSVQGIPAPAASADTLVELMTSEQIRNFHQNSPAPSVAYVPLLLSQGSALALPLAQAIIARLMGLFPEYVDTLAVLQDDLVWRIHVGPLGGA